MTQRPTLPGLVSQAQKPAQSASPGRVKTNTQLRPVAIRPQASPVDIFRGRPAVADARGSSLGQIASALGDLGTSLGALSAFTQKQDENKQRAGINQASLVSYEQVEASVNNRQAPVDVDPKAYWGEAGKRVGFNFMQTLQREAAENGTGDLSMEQFIDQRTAAEFERLSKLFEGDPNKEVLLDGFRRSINPDRYRIFKQEAQQDIQESRENHFNSVQQNFLDIMVKAREADEPPDRAMLQAMIDKYIADIPQNAKLAGVKPIDVAQALGQAAAHFAGMGDREMVELISNSRLQGPASGPLKTHPTFIAAMDRAEAKATSEHQRNIDKAAFGHKQDILQLATEGALGQGEINRLRTETGYSDDFWNRVSTVSRSSRQKAQKARLEAATKAQVLSGAMDAAEAGQLAAYMGKLEGSDFEKYAKDAEAYVRNGIEELYAGDPVRELESKLHFYSTNSAVTGKDPQWQDKISDTLSMIGNLGNGQPIPEEVNQGIQLYETIRNHSPWLAGKYVDGQEGQILESVITLRESRFSDAEIGTWVKNAQTAMLDPNKSRALDLSVSQLDKIIKADLGGLEVNSGGITGFFGATTPIANHNEIRGKVKQIADTLALGGVEPSRAATLAWERIKSGHTVINDVMVPVSAEQLPKNMPVILGAMSEHMVRHPKVFNGIDVSRWLKANGSESDDLFWMPEQDGNPNRWSLFSWTDVGGTRTWLPVTGDDGRTPVSMNMGEMTKQFELIAQQDDKGFINDVLKQSRKRKNAKQFEIDTFEAQSLDPLNNPLMQRF